MKVLLPVVTFMLMVEPVLVNVSPVVVKRLHPPLVSVIVEFVIVSVRVFELEEIIAAATIVLPFVFNEPAVRVMLPELPRVTLSCRVHPPPTPLNTKLPKNEEVKGTPFIVMVLPVVVALNVKVPVLFMTEPAPMVKLPLTVRSPDPPRVPVKPVEFRDKQPVFPVLMLTVTAPLAASKNTSSADVGTAAPPAPPDVVAHLVPAVPSQDAVPPTQNRAAITGYAMVITPPD